MSGADRPAGETKHDVVLVHGRTKDAKGYRAVRSRPGRLDAAVLRPLDDGKPLGDGEVIRLREREGSPILWDVEVEFRAPFAASATGDETHPLRSQADRGGATGSGRPASGDEAPRRSGPPRVVSESYRRGWDAIFGARRPEDPELPN